MKFPRRNFLRLAAGAAALPAVSRVGWAQAYPTRPVRIVVPYAPGSATDSVARIIAQKLSANTGRQFFVENISSPSGNVGMGRAAQAVPDGYTVLVVTSAYVVNPALYDKIPYDPLKSFQPVTLAVENNVTLTVNPSVAAQTINELVAVIRATPGKYSYASGGGIGSPGYLVGEQFRVSLGLDLVQVSFSGANLAAGSVVAGHTPIGFVAPSAAVPLVTDGKLRALAVTGNKRYRALPDVPTMAESGYPNIEGENWFGLLVPTGTPGQIIAMLNRETVKIIQAPDMKERLVTLGFEPVASTPEEFAERIKVEIETWRKVIRAVGINRLN
jgi:tripartite-type tricarboxylate transporter receptor subunit TctC